MEQLEQFIQQKLLLAKTYHEALKDIPGIKLPICAPWARNVFWLYTVHLDQALGITTEELLHGLLQNGIEARPFFYPLSSMPLYASYARPARLPVSDAVSATGVSLPSAVSLTVEEAQRVARELAKLIKLKELSKRSS